MPSHPRFVHTFSTTSRRVYRKGQSPVTERPASGIDELVNIWVKNTGHIILSATSSRHTVMERGGDGTVVRKTVHVLTVIYQPEEAFLESEVELRRRALVPSARSSEAVQTPQAVSDEEEHRERAVQSVAAPDHNAGGPEGLDAFLPLDEEDDG